MNQLAVFAKYWQPGRVKTRLAASVGIEPACRLYESFLHATLNRLQGTADNYSIVYTPADRSQAFADLAGDLWTLIPQSSGDLGSRLLSYLRRVVEASASQVVIVGSDSPTLPPDLVREAFASLREIPVVLGPTPDGGYYLIGVSGQVPPVFADIPWSTTAVWQETISRLSAAGMEYRVLAEWYDIDDKHDLDRLCRELNSTSDPHLQRLRRRMAEILQCTTS